MAEMLAVALTIPQARELQRAADAQLQRLRNPEHPEYSPDRARALGAASSRLLFVREAHDRSPVKAPGEPAAGRQPALDERTP